MRINWQVDSSISSPSLSYSSKIEHRLASYPSHSDSHLTPTPNELPSATYLSNQSELTTLSPVQLLCKILETHDLSLDCNKIAEAWPASDEMPTPRAIKERIVKIKALVSNALLEDQAKTTGEAGPSTPKPKRTRKPKATPPTPKTPKSAPDAESVDGSAEPGPPKKRKRTRKPKAKEEPVVEKTLEPSKSEDGEDDDESRADLEEEICEKLKVEEDEDPKEDDLA